MTRSKARGRQMEARFGEPLTKGDLDQIGRSLKIGGSLGRTPGLKLLNERNKLAKILSYIVADHWRCLCLQCKARISRSLKPEVNHE